MAVGNFVFRIIKGAFKCSYISLMYVFLYNNIKWPYQPKHSPSFDPVGCNYRWFSRKNGGALGQRIERWDGYEVEKYALPVLRSKLKLAGTAIELQWSSEAIESHRGVFGGALLVESLGLSSVVIANLFQSWQCTWEGRKRVRMSLWHLSWIVKNPSREYMPGLTKTIFEPTFSKVNWMVMITTSMASNSCGLKSSVNKT